jgi:uncharacterized heparinase superfamily protein
LRDSGYLCLKQGCLKAILDAAPIGPTYLPGHAHADTLSFELSLFGHRVFVNSGTSCYGLNAERQRQRGTAAHNTVVINHSDSSEVWGSFRVGNRATVQVETVSQDRHSMTVIANHTGYANHRGQNIHRRRWDSCEESFCIVDEITGSFDDAEARLYLHPRIKIGSQPATDTMIVLELPGGNQVTIMVDGGKLEYEPSTWHPEFGISEPNYCLIVHLRNALLKTTFSWSAAQ